MKRLLFPLVLAAMLATACGSTHLTVRVWQGGKIQQQVCVESEDSSVPAGSIRSANTMMKTTSGWVSFSDGCNKWETVDWATLVGYVGSSNNLYKCRVSKEFYEVVAEGQAYEIPTRQCRLVPPDLAEGTVQLP